MHHQHTHTHKCCCCADSWWLRSSPQTIERANQSKRERDTLRKRERFGWHALVLGPKGVFVGVCTVSFQSYKCCYQCICCCTGNLIRQRWSFQSSRTTIPNLLPSRTGELHRPRFSHWTHACRTCYVLGRNKYILFS